MSSSNWRSSGGQGEIRMVMVGKTGSGKSATGNTILGGRHFESKFKASSVTTDCFKRSAVVDGQQVTVIDTPGLFDTRFGMDKTTKDVCQCISYASPGPHIFLVVIGLGRFTPEEKQTVQRIQEIFGEAADRYSMVLFTRGDQLENTTIEEFLSGSEELQELIARCNGQYHVFDNQRKDRSQVTELLQKVREIVQKNGGSHYTNQMFKEAERALQQETERILKKKEEEMRREREELENNVRAKYEAEMKRKEKELQAERNRWENEKRKEEEERKRERERERERDRERESEREERDREREREREREEREREREERDREREREREMMLMRREMEEELEEKRRRLRKEQEREAREEAENNNVILALAKAAWGGVKKIWSWFTD